MQRYPKTLLTFEHWFRSEDACREYLFRFRWPNGFCCPRCEHGQAWKTGRGLWICGQCGKEVSVTAGTVFSGSKLSLRIWFRAIWWITNQKSGISALGLQRTLGLGSYETAWVLLHKLRRVMVRPGREQLSGMVEVDETVVGGRRKRVVRGRYRGPFVDKALVAVAAEVRGRGIGRIRLRQMTRQSKEQIMAFIKEVIAPGSDLMTDGWVGFRDLVEMGFTHRPIVEEEEKDLDWVLPRAHRVAALLKRWLLGIHQGRVEQKQLDYYLDEFVFRFNRRSSRSRGRLFYRLMQQAVAAKPIRYRDVIKGA